MNQAMEVGLNAYKEPRDLPPNVKSNADGINQRAHSIYAELETILDRVGPPELSQSNGQCAAPIPSGLFGSLGDSNTRLDMVQNQIGKLKTFLFGE